MKKEPGKVVQYINSENKSQFAIAYDKDQTPEIKNAKRVMLRLINEDMTPKLINGKQAIGVRYPSQLKTVGFID